MTAPLGGVTMGDRCLSALKALGGEATSGQVRVWVESDWRRPLTTAQVGTALACLSREHPPRVTRHPVPGGGHVWRTAEAETWTDPPRPWEAGFRPFTAADAQVLAGELPVLEATLSAAVRQAGEAAC